MFVLESGNERLTNELIELELNDLNAGLLRDSLSTFSTNANGCLNGS